MFSKFLDYIILIKPELTGLSVFTAVITGVLASNSEINFQILFLIGFGTLLVGGGAGVINQYIERNYDALMKRTEKRPIPDKRILPNSALLYGIIITISGILILYFFVNPLSSIISFFTWFIYIGIYTPLKRKTFLATVIGAIPGALPPLIGWAGIKNELNFEAWILFAIIFLWQMPHFYSLAWIYRNDYAKAEFQMLSVTDPTGKAISMEILFNSTFLIPVSLLPIKYFLLNENYFYFAIVLNIVFMYFATMFILELKKYNQQVFNEVNKSARKLFFSSLFYLPIIFILIFYFKR